MVGCSGFCADAFFVNELSFVVDEFAAVAGDALAERAGEVARVEMAVLGEEDAADGIDVGVGFEFGDAGGVDEFRLKAEAVG